MQRKQVNYKTFKTPFCREYWKLAFAEFKNTKMIVFAALILALRIAVKPLSIPVAGDLKEGIGFIVNAFGSMICTRSFPERNQALKQADQRYNRNGRIYQIIGKIRENCRNVRQIRHNNASYKQT